jgi:two-component system sensor histidine kinase KdpD
MSDPDEIVRVGRTADELRADCLRLLAHDLNNPLTAIRILAEMLRDELPNPEMRQDIIDILEAADLAGALMDGLSSLVRLEGREEEYTWFPIDMVDVLRLAVDRPALRRHVRLETPREIQMGGDRMALQRCFTDILVNARRLVDGRLPIPVEATEGASDVVVRVHHAGPGIPEGLRPRLLEMYGAVELRQNRIPVAAAGLVYARSVIEVHGGTLAFEDGDRGGMDLVVRLPR